MADQSASAQKWRGFNVMVASPTPSHPQDLGNRKRIHAICEALTRQGAKIHFIHYPGEFNWRHAWPAKDEEAMRQAWASYQLVAPSVPLHTLAKGDDHDIDEWADPSLTHFIAWACRVRAYDMVIVNYTWMSFCLDAVPADVFKVCDTHDVFGDRRHMLEANGIAPEFFHTTREGEARGLARADLVWAIKDEERLYFERDLQLANCLTMLHAEPARELWTGPPSTDGWMRAGMIGARNNVNRTNFEQFLNVALKVLHDHMAPVKIVLAGGCCDDFTGWSHPNLEIMGRLPDVAQFYRAVDVVIAPMQFSTGLKIKVSEALASGAPLIAHAHATEGYPTQEPLHLLDDFRGMAIELAKLGFDRAPLAALAESSRRVCADIQTEVDEALEATRLQLVDKLASMICMILPFEALDRASLLHDHFLAALDYLRFASGVAVYIAGGAEAIPSAERNLAEALGRFDLRNQVFADPQLMQDLGEAAPESWIAFDLNALLETRGFERAYLMTDGCAKLVGGRLRQILVRADAIDLGGGDADALIEDLRGRFEIHVISAAGRALLRWREASGVAGTLRAPFRRNGPFESIGARARPAGGQGLIMILAADADPLAEDLAELANRLGMDAAILDPDDRPVAREVVRGPNERGAVDPLGFLAEARLLVDLTPQGSLAAVLGETALRRDIPRLVFQRGAMALGLRAFPSALRPGSLRALFSTVARMCGEPDFAAHVHAAARQEFEGLAAHDAGWSQIWAILKKPCPVEPSARDAMHEDVGRLLLG